LHLPPLIVELPLNMQNIYSINWPDRIYYHNEHQEKSEAKVVYHDGSHFKLFGGIKLYYSLGISNYQVKSAAG
jgi:hypothetical protein